MNRKKHFSQNLRHYIESQMSLFIFVTVLFVVGVVFGSVIVNTMSPEQKEGLLGYLGHFFRGLEDESIADPKIALQHSIGNHLKTIGLMWVLGLSIIGLPLILILVFLKGLVIGFTVGFLVSQLSWQGLWFAFVSVVPQNLLVVPVLIFAAVSGIHFSMLLIRSRLIQRRGTIYPQFISYSIQLSLLAFILILASFFEAYLSPVFMRLALPS